MHLPSLFHQQARIMLICIPLIILAIPTSTANNPDISFQALRPLPPARHPTIRRYQTHPSIERSLFLASSVVPQHALIIHRPPSHAGSSSFPQSHSPHQSSPPPSPRPPKLPDLEIKYVPNKDAHHAHLASQPTRKVTPSVTDYAPWRSNFHHRTGMGEIRCR
jgi:hypothetical protein